MTLRCYFIKADPDECEGFAIVAKTARDAKKLAWKSKTNIGLFDWIDIRVIWQRGTDVSGFKEGHVLEPLEGLKLGCYSWVEEECPICKKETMLTLEGGIIGCSDCLP
jgi:hypothetical protein